MELGTIRRAFDVVRFKDRYGKACSLQKSIIVTEDCVWLGRDDIAHIAGNRMHLTREQVRDLLPFLQHFAETGELTERSNCEHVWGIDGQHSNEYCKKCFVSKPGQGV